MKITSLILASMTGLVAISVQASTAFYGTPKQSTVKATGKNDATASYVIFNNYTADNYTAYATFYDSKTRAPDMYVGPRGSGTDVIYYTVDYPVDHEVCIQVHRNSDKSLAFYGCLVPSSTVILDVPHPVGNAGSAPVLPH